jgi:hypothetical protein
VSARMDLQNLVRVPFGHGTASFTGSALTMPPPRIDNRSGSQAGKQAGEVGGDQESDGKDNNFHQ